MKYACIEKIVHDGVPSIPAAVEEKKDQFPEEWKTASDKEECQETDSDIVLDSTDEYLLRKIAMAEAEEEDVEGKALVMLVVLNRVKSDEFPDTISKVIFQKNQFSPVLNGRFFSVEPDRECREALELIQMEKWDESQGALYFESEGESDWHKDNLDYLFQHGNHYFYTDKEKED
ncbi:MAG: cell wall hydrolase [Lachnospiraceae bacterium]|nr:cell wall hydrolase [Lachnospiraceae bacterium]